MNSDPFDPFAPPPFAGGLPDWSIVTIYLLPVLVWLIAWRRSHRFSIRGLFVLIAVYAGLLAVTPRPSWTYSEDPAADEAFLEEVERLRVSH